MDLPLVALASPSPLFLRKVFKGLDLVVDLSVQSLENKGANVTRGYGNRKLSGER